MMKEDILMKIYLQSNDTLHCYAGR